MRTNIDIDDELMKAAMEATGFKTKRQTVEAALKTLVDRRAAQQKVRSLRGTVEWDGDLNAMRRDR